MKKESRLGVAIVIGATLVGQLLSGCGKENDIAPETTERKAPALKKGELDPSPNDLTWSVDTSNGENIYWGTYNGDTLFAKSVQYSD